MRRRWSAAGLMGLEGDWIGQLYVEPDMDGPQVRRRVPRAGQAAAPGRAPAVEIRIDVWGAAVL